MAMIRNLGAVRLRPLSPQNHAYLACKAFADFIGREAQAHIIHEFNFSAPVDHEGHPVRGLHKAFDMRIKAS